MEQILYQKKMEAERREKELAVKGESERKHQEIVTQEVKRMQGKAYINRKSRGNSMKEWEGEVNRKSGNGESSGSSSQDNQEQKKERSIKEEERILHG